MKRPGVIARSALLLALAATGLTAGLPVFSAATAAPAPAAAPASTATWKSIDANLQQLDTLIRAGKLDDLGSAAYGIANLFKTLPSQSSALPAAKLALVTANVKVVGGIVSKLDKAGESGNKGAVDTDLKALKDALAPLRALYAPPPTK